MKTSEYSTRINLLDLVIPDFDFRAAVEKLMHDNPEAPQGEIYRLALRDKQFVNAAATRAVTDALVKLRGRIVGL
jgi:hypothetical protein